MEESSLPLTKTEHSATTSSLPKDSVINLLLLGESGVGKSTFINAFVNYHTFRTLEEAESKQPVALMPVSFLMTVGDNFIEQIVELNVPDVLNNEDFKHTGQSVTQRCKSYSFTLNSNGGKKLRIIDTPGFGDTRGLDQDDTNMQHILEYINHFTHFNAICFLLKPNSSRLHIFFRTCLTQLIDLLGPNALQNIIFCFTNARATFYTPGDTAPLLRTMLNSLPTKDIVFKKDNTFCFDNESFRYLVARQNGITFKDEVRCDYEASWLKSVTELHRLLDYICQNLPMYRMLDDWQSIKHAQLEIIDMVRPMLETMRNALRNIILYNSDSKKRSIELSAKSIHRPIIICLLCNKHQPDQFANFWILPDCEHNVQNDKHHKCPNASSQHIPREYKLEYNVTSDRSIKKKNELWDQVSLLNDASAVFSNFLRHTAVISRDDLFLTGLERILWEEKYICKQKGNSLNIELSKQVEGLICKYKRSVDGIKGNEKKSELSTIYNWIKLMQDVPEVSIQMAASKIARQCMMEYYEYEVPNNSKDESISDPNSF